MSKISTISFACMIGVAAISFSIATPIIVFAQNKSATTGSLSDQEDPLFNRIKAVSAKSKTVESAKGYSEIVTECDALLAEKLKKDSYRSYLKKLLAWALDKRGESRLLIAEQFRSIGNEQQANQIIQQAVADLDRSIENDPKRWQTFMHRGAMLVANEDYAKAELDYSQVVKLNPKKTAAQFNRAEIRYELAKFKDAMADYQAVLKVDSNDVQALSGRANCFLALKKNDEALRDYNRVVELSPNDAWALANRSDAFLASSDWVSAKSDLEKANSLRTNGELMRRLAWLLSTCTDDTICDGKQALALAKRAIELTGETPQGLDTLAASFAADGQFDQARDIYSRAIALLENEDPSSKVKQAAYENNERYQEKFDR